MGDSVFRIDGHIVEIVGNPPKWTYREDDFHHRADPELEWARNEFQSIKNAIQSESAAFIAEANALASFAGDAKARALYLATLRNERRAAE